MLTRVKAAIKSIQPVEWFSLLAIAYILGIRIAGIFSYNVDIEGVEFANIHFLQLLKLNHHLYYDPSQFPFLLIVYTPLYYYAMDLITAIFSIDPVRDIHLMFVAGRIVSMVLLFVSFYNLVKTIELLIGKFSYKIFLFLLLLLFISIHFYTARPDSFKVTCFTLFLFFSVRYQARGSIIDFLLGFIFIATGIMFKQDLVVYGCLFYGTFFLLYRKAIYFFGAPLLIATICLIFLIILHVSGINLFRDLFIYNIQYDSDFHINMIIIFIFLLRTSLLLYFAYRNLKTEDKLIRSMAVLSFVYVAGCLLMLLRMGSNFNYTYEAVFLLLINAAVYFRRIKLKKFVYPLHVYMAFLALSIALFYPFYVNAENERVHKYSFAENVRLAKRINEIVGNDVLFLPNMKFYVFYPQTKLIYGYDWHYDRYCELNLYITLKPKFADNDVVKLYDQNFSNGVVKYIVVDDEPKSIRQLGTYYPKFKFYTQVENLLVYKYSGNTN